MFHRARVWLLLFNFLGSFVFAQTPPVITGALSARQVVAAGSDLALSFSVTGATGLQWMRNGRPIAGATNASVTITSVDYSTDSGWYHLVATNSEGTATSSTVFVNVAPRSPQVIGWGNNSYGSGQINVPANLTDAVAIAAGDEFSLALKADGKVVAWGDNSVGQTSVPSALADVVAIAAGTLHAMALRSDGSVTVWGANQAGERTVPAGLGNVVAIAGGGAHCLALKSDGTVVAWGYNNAGQATVPTGLTSVASLAAGYSHSFAVKQDGSVVSWGAGALTAPAGLSNIRRIATGDSFGVALKADRALMGWGSYSFGTPLPSGLTGVRSLTAGRGHAAALKDDGTVMAWGGNSSGQASPPAGLRSVVSVAAGNLHTLALREAVGDTVPTVLQQPASRTVLIGQTTEFFASFDSGGPAVTYQWKKDGVDVPGATGTRFSITNSTTANSGSYTIVARNYLGARESSAAILQVVQGIEAQATGTISNGGNTFGDSASISFYCSFPNRIVYYSTDGSDPYLGGLGFAPIPRTRGAQILG